jgi:signal transduction histidine kinase
MVSWIKSRASPEQIFLLPPERVIAFARLTLTAFTICATFFDPPRDSHDAQITYIVASGYLAFAIIAFCVVMLRPPRRWEQLVAHTVDISCVCLLMHFNDGPNSPYFIFFTFILLSAALRWGWRGAMETTVLLGLIFLLFILLMRHRPEPVYTDFGELSRSIFRPAYLVVSGVMLAYVSALKERGRRQLAKLAAWPGPDHDHGLPVPIKSALAHAGHIMRAPRVLIIWEPFEEPYRDVALWSPAGLEYSREAPDRFGTLVAAPLIRKSFVAPREDGAAGSLVVKEVAVGNVIDEDLRRTFSIQSAISAPFFLPACRGRVFLLDTETNDDSELLLAELIANRIGVDLEHYWLRNELETAAGSRERERLARDLHDGVLQGLAAANIHLSLSSDRVEHGIAERLTQTRQLLSAEQQRIRTFVENSRSRSKALLERVDLAPDVNRILEHLSQIWTCQVHITVEPPDLQVSAEAARNVRHFLAEAASNAVRHGKASQIDVAIKAATNRLHLTITDNGLGFPDLHGFYSGEELSSRNIGPHSLRTRAEDMGGAMSLRTSPSGTEVHVEVPL